MKLYRLKGEHEYRKMKTELMGMLPDFYKKFGKKKCDIKSHGTTIVGLSEAKPTSVRRKRSFLEQEIPLDFSVSTDETVAGLERNVHIKNNYANRRYRFKKVKHYH